MLKRNVQEIFSLMIATGNKVTTLGAWVYISIIVLTHAHFDAHMHMQSKLDKSVWNYIQKKLYIMHR